MAGEYNLGTASGRIEIDGRPGALGFKVAESAASTFFGAIQSKVNSVQTLGKRVAAVGTAGAVGFGAAIKVAASFEKQMSAVQAVSNATGDEYDALRNKALQLGADTTFSASEAALAIEELAKAGIPIEDILNGAADGAVALAAAGGIGLAEAAEVAGNAMNQFGIDASKMTEVADILAGVANTSAADVSGLRQSLAQSGAVANLAGLSFRDTAIALGEMADAGIQGSDAGTSLKTMLNNLIPTTEKQSNLFKDLGLLTYDLAGANKALAKEGLGTASSIDEAKTKLSAYLAEMGKGNVGTVKNAKAVDELLQKYGGLSNAFFDASGKVKNLRDLQETLNVALKGMTREQKLAAVETLFGADAMRASAILSLEGAKGYDEFSNAMKGVSAADVAKTRMNNLDGAIEQFKGSMETAMITIGSVFLPVLTKIVQGITFLVNAFNKLPGPVKTGIAILLAIASAGAIVVGGLLALLPVIIGMVANFLLMKSLGFVLGFFKSLVVAARAGTLGLVTVQAAAGRTGAAFLALGGRTLFAGKLMLGFSKIMARVWVALTGPIGIAVAAIAALVAIGVLLYNKWEPFRNLVDSIVAKVKSGLVSAFNAMKPVVAAVVAALIRFGSFVRSTLLPVLAAVGRELLGKLMDGWKQISAAVKSDLVPALQQLASKFNGEVLPALKKLWTAIQPAVMAFLKFAGVVGGYLIKVLTVLGKIFISYVLPALIKVAGFFGGVLIQAIVDFVLAVVQVIKGIVQVFTGLIDFFKGLFTGNWSQMWNGLVTIVKGVGNLLIGAVKILLMVGIGKIFSLAFKLFGAIVRGGWSLIGTIFRAGGRLLMTILRGALNLIRALISRYITMWRTLFSAGWRLIVAVVKGAINLVRTVIGNVLKGIVNFIRGNLKAAQNNFKSAWDAVRSATSKAFERIKDAVRSAVGKVLETVRGIPGKVRAALGNLSGTLYNAGRELISGFTRGIAEKIGSAVQTVRDGLGKIRGLLPGSPIKWGPLKSWNRGGAGKRLIRTLTDGINAERGTAVKAAENTARAIQTGYMTTLGSNPVMLDAMAFGTAPAVAPSQVAATVAPAAAPAAATPAQNGRLRLVEGSMRIDESGRVWVRGVAEEVVGETRMDEARTGRRSFSRG